MRKLIDCAIALTFFAVGVALAQNADLNSAGPTKNDLKIRVTEPLEGAKIIGTTVRVAIDFERPLYREQGAIDKGLDKFPPPRFDVFLDNDLRQILKSGMNVATIENIPPGPHKIVILAKNISGEVVDRKEIEIWTQAPLALEKTPEPVKAETVAPAPQPVAQAAPQPEPPPVAEPEAIPRTASPYPALALAGLVLMAAGLILGRR